MLTKTFKSNQHITSITLGLKQIFYTKIASFFIMLLITLALLFALIFYSLWQNIGSLNEKWNESAEISIYLKKKIGLKEAGNLIQKLQQNPIVKKVELLKPAEGIKVFTETTTLKTLLSSFKENPLPTVIIVYPEVKILAENIALQFIKELNSLPEVETVKTDIEWLKRSYYWLNLLNHLSQFFAFLFGINAFLVISIVSYITTKDFTLKNNVNKKILQYQFAWLGLISSLVALLWNHLFSMIIQNQGIMLAKLSVESAIFIVLISMLLSFISSKIGTKN